MTDEVLTIKDVAGLLKLAEKTVYSMAQLGELPAFRIRGHWRFKRVDLDRWIEERKLEVHGRGTRPARTPHPAKRHGARRG